MPEWLKKTFPAMADGTVIIYADPFGMKTFDPSDPAGQFSTLTGVSATTPPTYAALSALPCAGAQGNWQHIFDQWKALGLIA